MGGYCLWVIEATEGVILIESSGQVRFGRMCKRRTTLPLIPSCSVLRKNQSLA